MPTLHRHSARTTLQGHSYISELGKSITVDGVGILKISLPNRQFLQYKVKCNGARGLPTNWFKEELNPKPHFLTLKSIISGYIVVLFIDSSHNLDIFKQF